jgi:hypothetical protein
MMMSASACVKGSVFEVDDVVDAEFELIPFSLIVGDGCLFIRNVFFLLVDSQTAGHVDLCFVVHSVV